MEIVHTVAQRDLRKRQSETNPIRRQVVDVVEVNTAHRKIAQLLKCRGALDLGKYSVGLRRLEREGNKSGKPSGFSLQFTQLAQMIRAMSKGFDVSVKHRACAAAAHRMPGAMHVEPFAGGFLAPTDLIANDRVENLGAAPGNRTESGLAQNFQRVADRHLKDALRQVTNLDRGE